MEVVSEMESQGRLIEQAVLGAIAGVAQAIDTRRVPGEIDPVILREQIQEDVAKAIATHEGRRINARMAGTV